MKAKLNKVDNGYVLLVNNIMYATDNDKLSKQNCDEIFEVVDVDKLAENYEKENFNGDLEHHPLQIFKEGFNKAMELNEEKVFTLEDMYKAIEWAREGGIGWYTEDSPYYYFDNSVDEIIQSLQQPTEIEVEIEMKKIVDETKVVGAVKNVKGSGDKITTYKSLPKLDLEGCLILKKI